MSYQHHPKPDLDEQDIARLMETIETPSIVLGQAMSQDMPKAFRVYAKEILKLQEQDKLSPMEAAYAICGCVQYPELSDDPGCDAIINLACSLELPEDQMTKPAEGSWQELVTKITS